MENKVVMGIFNNRGNLENAVEDLREEGFRNADISALLPSAESTKEFVHVQASKVPEGTAAGGTAGAVIGGALGWLAGVGALAIPGLGAFIALGPIMGTLAGAGTGGVIGGIAGALAGWGFPEYEARRYEGMVKEGGNLLSVHCDDENWADRARIILEDNGAHDVSRSSEFSCGDTSTREGKPGEAQRY